MAVRCCTEVSSESTMCGSSLFPFISFSLRKTALSLKEGDIALHTCPSSRTILKMTFNSGVSSNHSHFIICQRFFLDYFFISCFFTTFSAAHFLDYDVFPSRSRRICSEKENGEQKETLYCRVERSSSNLLSQDDGGKGSHMTEKSL